MNKANIKQNVEQCTEKCNNCFLLKLDCTSAGMLLLLLLFRVLLFSTISCVVAVLIIDLVMFSFSGFRSCARVKASNCQYDTT